MTTYLIQQYLSPDHVSLIYWLLIASAVCINGLIEITIDKWRINKMMKPKYMTWQQYAKFLEETEPTLKISTTWIYGLAIWFCLIFIIMS